MWIEIYFKSNFYENVVDEIFQVFLQLTVPNLNKEYASMTGKLMCSLEDFRKKISNLKSKGIDIEWKKMVDF